MNRLFASLLLIACPSLAFTQAAETNGFFDGQGNNPWKMFKPLTPAGPLHGFSFEQDSDTAPLTQAAGAVQVLVPGGKEWKANWPKLRDSLQKEYGFVLETGPRFVQIAGIAPIAPLGHVVVEADIRITPWNAQKLAEDSRVRGAWQKIPLPANGPYTKENLFRLVRTGSPKAKTVKGFVALGVGYDCGIETPHTHILAHKPAIWVYYEASINPRTFQLEMGRAIAELRRVPVVYKAEFYRPDSMLPVVSEKRHCFLPEGCDGSPFLGQLPDPTAIKGKQTSGKAVTSAP